VLSLESTGTTLPFLPFILDSEYFSTLCSIS